MSRLASTWAAVRYRRSQSVALVLVSALVTTCAVFAPVFVRTLEQGLLRARLVETDPADTSVLVRGARTAAATELIPDDLAAVMPEEATSWFGEGVGMTTVQTRVQPQPGKDTSPLRIVARHDLLPLLARGAPAREAPGQATAALDAVGLGEVHSHLVEELSGGASGAAVIMTTHDPEAAAAADRVVHLDDGVLTTT